MLKIPDKTKYQELSQMSAENLQLTLNLEPQLTERFRNVRDVVTAGVYQRGLTRVAGALDVAPGNLSCMLSDDSQRKLGVDDLERYIQTQGDLTPVYYLIARYLGDQAIAEAATMKRLESLLQEVAALGVQIAPKKARER
jgi:hypothetical protein